MSEDQPSIRNRTRQLGAWFLGPKAENASLEEEMILHILRDYFHWRRNYYPSDEITITQHMRREALDWTDALFQQISEMLARLRRHFPFYSPRYIAHMLSDQTIPSVLGYFAGMLYNPNNVTPEAAPVTVEWELEVAADILNMLGYAPPPASAADHRATKKEFGWAHITSGGTVANIEALWVARNVRYLPLAVKRAAQRDGIALAVKLPGETQARSITGLDDPQCLALKPNSATFLLIRFIEALRKRWNLSEADATRRAWEALSETGFAVAHSGAAACFSSLPPALFVSGTAHYSLSKAADLLGIGRDHLVFVDVDRTFRLEVRDLEDKLKAALRRGQVPLAVVAIAGTTEEGSVDPVHRIDDFRRRLEQDQHTSFWLHVDAAWAGYLRSLFVNARGGQTEEAERIASVNRFASRRLEIKTGRYERTMETRWGSKEVCRAFLAFPRAESIVVDPHKMGYIPYPCGVVAFRNDRVRHFLSQQAPYITRMTHSDAAAREYSPPANVGPFILEGSKPGAAAASCWLSHRMIPPHRDGYGEIARASLLAARELYERLVHWEHSCQVNRTPANYQFVPVAGLPPDTNIVCFVIKEKHSRSLKRMNALAEAVYQHLTIQAETGDRGYSYSQPFFISRTRFQLPNYSLHSVAGLLERAEVDLEEYPAEGVFVLRATVMTPYITLAAETGHKQSYLAEFTETLARITAEALPGEHKPLQGGIE
ncbi:MAG: pyridoxal-dependent decarboxylase [Bryobacteraceae bacterium]